jgi:hypothetical protein
VIARLTVTQIELLGGLWKTAELIQV